LIGKLKIRRFSMDENGTLL